VTNRAPGTVSQGRADLDLRGDTCVVVIDDEVIIAENMCEFLTRHGYQAIAFTGSAALERIQLELPKLVITDIELPDIRGDKLALQICRQVEGCRAILMSGGVAPDDIAEAARGFVFLQKPRQLRYSAEGHQIIGSVTD